MIVRGPRPEGNFYILDKRISEDRRLSWGARGLLVYLLGKPDNWQIFPAALVQDVSDSGKPIGRDATYALISELIGTGYVRREQTRNADGTVGAARYVVSEQPHTENPEAVPHPGLPYTVEPYPANPTQTSTDSNQSSKGKKNLKRPGLATRPDDVAEQVWSDFQVLRKAKRAPVTETVIDGIRAEAQKASMTVEDALRYCCSRGWQGFKAEWIDNENGRAAHSKQPQMYARGGIPIHPSWFQSSGSVIDMEGVE